MPRNVRASSSHSSTGSKLSYILTNNSFGLKGTFTPFALSEFSGGVLVSLAPKILEGPPDAEDNQSMQGPFRPLSARAFALHARAEERDGERDQGNLLGPG